MARKLDKRKDKRKTKIGDASGFRRKKRPCIICKQGMDYIDYKDVALLRRFISERGKIRARRVTGCCAKHQHEVSVAIKNAREMALLPYMTK
ncbi:MAG: 30S ribosomal protein S18 [Acidimicrobiia bacterium]